MANPEAQALLRIARRDLKAAEVLQIPSIDESSWGFQIQQAARCQLDRRARLPNCRRAYGELALLPGLLEPQERVPVFAADKAKALEAGKELFPGHRVTVVLKEGEPGA